MEQSDVGKGLKPGDWQRQRKPFHTAVSSPEVSSIRKQPYGDAEKAQHS